MLSVLGDIFLFALPVMSMATLCLWLVSLRVGRVSFVDAYWGFGFVLLAWLFFAAHGYKPALAAHYLILALLSVWGLRLSGHLYIRYKKQGEDRRYVALLDRVRMPRALFTLVFVFWMQNMLIILVALPVLEYLTREKAAMNGWVLTGSAMWLAGFLFEAVSDWQLARFKRNPENAGKTLTTGLWAWSRHPNYFGDCLLWWGLWTIGHNPYLIFAPLFMTYTFLKWTGIPLLEPNLAKKRTGYKAYQKDVSPFLPWPPRGQKPPPQ